MEPVSNVGRFTRILLIIIGIVLIVIGTVISTLQLGFFTGEDQTTAEIVGFRVVQEELPVNTENTVTLVKYTVNGKQYDQVELGQYEKLWKEGDQLTICYNREHPEQIRTKTMTYIGFIIILASFPFIIIGIYTLTNLNRQAAKTPEEIAEDEERTTAGKLKYKVSSIVISLATGIPVTLIGLMFIYLEHHSVFGLLCTVMGIIATLVGLRSVLLFVIIKYRHKKEFDRMIRKNVKMLAAPDESHRSE